MTPEHVCAQAVTEELLAVKELAAYWRVSPKTVYRMIWARELPAQRIRGQWRIRRVRRPAYHP